MKRITAVLLAVGSLLAAAAPATADQKLADTVASSGSWINTSSYTPPLFINYSGTSCMGSVTSDASTALTARWQNVPLGCSFTASAGSDGEAVVLDKVTGRTYEFWRAYKASDGTWHARWGGGDDDANFHWSNGVRAWDRPDGVPYGVQASGLAFTPGLITVSDLYAGAIRHPVHLLVPQACATYKPPATSTDAATTMDQPGCFQYGTIYKLPQGVDISRLPFIARVIAQAAKDYGLVVSDQTHASVGFRAENWQRDYSWWSWAIRRDGSRINPYSDPAGKAAGFDFFGCDGTTSGRPAEPGTNEWDCVPDRTSLLRDFPWRDLVQVN
jgi:hypothetical protein